LVGLRMVFATPHLEPGDHLCMRQISAVLLIAASVLAILVSFFSPHLALWAFALPLLVPPLMRRTRAVLS